MNVVVTFRLARNTNQVKAARHFFILFISCLLHTADTGLEQGVQCKPIYIKLELQEYFNMRQCVRGCLGDPAQLWCDSATFYKIVLIFFY